MQQIKLGDLQVDVRLWKSFSGALHECINKAIIFFSSDSPLFKAQVKIIIEQFLVLRCGNSALDTVQFERNTVVTYICSTIQYYRELPLWMDSSTQRRYDKLCQRNQDSTHALVSNS